jgi:hypothetical protein
MLERGAEFSRQASMGDNDDPNHGEVCILLRDVAEATPPVAAARLSEAAHDD